MSTGTFEIRVGDCSHLLRSMPDESVDCVVTSPPYWALRNYEAPGQIGLEESLDEYLDKLVAIFEQVRRVLKPRGTCWVNMGDKYAQTGRGGVGKASTLEGGGRNQHQSRNSAVASARRPNGLKNKDLIGLPWRLALAMQAAGWYLRAENIWHKPAPMPESCVDRPTRSHEQVFLFSKRSSYWYDADAIREETTDSRVIRAGEWNRLNGRRDGQRRATRRIVPISGWAHGPGSHHPHELTRADRDAMRAFNRRRATDVEPRQGPIKEAGRDEQDLRMSTDMGRGAGWRAKIETIRATRNCRSVWTIASVPFKGDHYATYPPKLVERCVLSGCPPDGIVLDPFSGAGTTGLVALRHGRRYVGIEINERYAEMSRKRIAEDVPLYNVEGRVFA